MNPKKVSQSLLQYNALIRETDELYHNVAKNLRLPDCAFWILYSLRESELPLTQSDICNSLYYSKQTVNSALKKLETDGYIALCSLSDRRRKQLHLTEKGYLLTANTIDRVIDAELEALSDLSEQDRALFLAVFEKYTTILKQKMKVFERRTS